MRPGAAILCACIVYVVLTSRAHADSPPYALWSTYVGGSGQDGAYAVDADRDGNVLIGGETASFDLLQAAGIEPPENQGGKDAIVVKLSPDGSEVLAVFSIGGPGDDLLLDLKVAEGGDVFVLGDLAAGFVPPEDACPAATGVSGARDIFVARLDTELELIALQLVGGSGDDRASDMDVTGDGIVSILGNTTSRDLATTPGAFQQSFQGGATDYMIARLDLSPAKPCDERMVYVTYVGSSSTDETAGYRTNAGLVADSSGTLTLAGRTTGGLLYPHTAAFGSLSPGGYDVAVTQLLCDPRLDPAEQLRFSALLGGSDEEAPKWVGLTSDGNIQVVGWTWSAGFPMTTGTPFRGQNDIFVTEIDPRSSQLVISEFIGGNSYDPPGDCIGRPDGSILIGGVTGGGTFPVTPDALRPADGVDQAFLLEWRRDLGATPAGRILYATALTSGAWVDWYYCDRVWDLALAPDGTVLACGFVSGTLACDTAGGAQPLRTGGAEMFVVALDLRSPDARCTAAPLEGTPPLEVCFDASASTSPEGTEITEYRWTFGDGEELATAGANVCHVYTEPGRYVCELRVTNDLGLMSTEDPPLAITVGCPSGPVAPWTAADIGSPLFPGSARTDGDDILLCAGGAGFLARDDELHFVHQAFSGDFILSVHCAEVSSWAAGASLGLMARASLDTGAPYAAIALENLTSSVRPRFRYRESAESNARSRAGPPIEIPQWLRLERSGDVFVARASADGAAWEEVDRQEIPGLPASLLAGLVAAGHDAGDETMPFTPLQARVSDLVLEAADVPFSRGDANDSGTIDLSDAVFTLGYLFLGGPAPSCLDAADADDSGGLEITDAVYSLGYLFLGGPAPPAPFGACGPDTTADDLTCVSSAACEQR